MSKNNIINYTASIITEEYEADGTKNMFIVGNAIEAGVSRNKVNYSGEELRAAAKTLIGKPLLLNHGDEDVRNIVGKVVEADYENGSVPFKAMLDSTETQILHKIKNGFINKVSIGAMFDDALTERDANGIVQARGIEFLELSLVPIPGVPNAGISQVLHEKYQTMEVVKMENFEKENAELKVKLEELEAKLAATEKVEEPAEEPAEEPKQEEPVKEDENYKALQEKLAALEKKLEANKGLVKVEKKTSEFKENWAKSEAEGKKDFWLTDKNGKTLY